MDLTISITRLTYKRVKYFTLLYFFMGLLSTTGFSQERQIRVYPTIGVSWRSTAMNFFNFKAVIRADPTVPYNYERNVQGFSINTGVSIQSQNFEFEYYPNWRYDVINSVLGLDDTYVKGFIVDHNFNFTLRRKINYGVGISVVNFRTGFSFENPIGVQRYQSIEFNTYNAFVTFPYKKILFIELKALYVPNGFPENPYEQYIMYSLRVYYKLNFSKSKHPSN
jgi:hypothetical protein